MEVMNEMLIDNPLMLIVKKHLFHHFNQQMIVTVLAEALDEAKKFLNFAENIDALHPDGEKSQILSILTAYIDYAPNLITTL